MRLGEGMGRTHQRQHSPLEVEGGHRLLTDGKERAEVEDFASVREEGPLAKSQSCGSSQYFLETVTMLTQSVQ